MQAIVDACRDGRLHAEPRVVISNNSRSTALERARREGIPRRHVSGVTHPDPGERDAAIAEILRLHGVDLVILSGYMKRIGPRTLAAYRWRILNVHPAPLPRFGGAGMYGDAVHRAVLGAGARVTGATVHLVDDLYDHGPPVASREVPVLPGDTVHSLRERVRAAEHGLYVDTLRGIAGGGIDLDVIARSQPGPRERWATEAAARAVRPACPRPGDEG